MWGTQRIRSERIYVYMNQERKEYYYGNNKQKLDTVFQFEK